MAKIENIDAKRPVVAEIAEVLNGSQTAVLVDHRGLTVAEDTELRKTLREAGIQYKVYKNTFISRAVENTANAELKKLLDGPSALAVSKTDATGVSREIVKFAKTHAKLEIKGGIVDGKFCDADGIKAVATIPSKEILIGRLLGSMQSPIANLARVLKQIAEKDSAPAEASAEA